MATPTGQRIGIWVIAIVMAIGAIGTYFVVIMANNNDKTAAEQQQELIDQFLEQQKKLQEQHAASSKPLDGYTAEAFDAGSVTSLQSEDLVVGDGQEVKADSTIEANYFGWTADGKIFDSTNQNGVVTPSTFGLQPSADGRGVIVGWTEGLTGSRVGTVRKVLIPTDKAYGATAEAEGKPAGPLAFIVQITAIK